MLIAIICTLVFGLAIGFWIGYKLGKKSMYDYMIEISQAEDVKGEMK